MTIDRLLAARRRWYRRIGLALFVWLLETLIGLIPYIAHVALSSLIAPRTDADSVLPELCILSVVTSALALLALLRDWFKGEAPRASALTVSLAIANVLACLAGSFLYALAGSSLLTSGAHAAPSLMLLASLAASLLLAAERGFSSER